MGYVISFLDKQSLGSWFQELGECKGEGLHPYVTVVPHMVVKNEQGKGERGLGFHWRPGQISSLQEADGII